MRKTLTLLLLLFSGLLLSGCGDNFSWHQKMVVEVETPDGVKIGSSVVAVEVTAYEKPLPLTATVIQRKIRGEAAFVGLGEGQYLFVLLKGADTLAQRTFFKGRKRNINHAGPRLSPFFGTPEYGGSVSLGGKRAPLLVTFTDINDPSSVQKVEPNDLAAHFGAGVKLKRITLEITSEPVTKGRVEKVLGWLGDPDVMENPGWRTLPIEARRAIGGLLSYFPKLKGNT